MFVITGVTGNTGSIAAQALLDAKQNIRVVVRSEEKGQAWKDKGAEVFVADLFDADAMTQALTGAKAAYLMLPPDVTSETFLQSRRELADTLRKAADQASLPHVVLLSSVGAELTEKNGPIASLSYLEEAFASSSIKKTALRPGYFMENWAALLPAVLNQNILPSFLPLDFELDMIATHDIGEAIADSLLNPIEGVVELKGTQKYTPREIAEAFSSSLGKEITPIEVPQEGWVPSLTDAGLSNDFAGLIAEMYENIANGRIDHTSNSARSGKVTLETFIQRLIA